MQSTKTGKFWGRTYTVVIDNDGAIKVKPRDWLSKYSVAMFSDIKHVHEYGRKDRTGVVRPVENRNLIFAGETLYHIPTYEKWRQNHGSKPVMRMDEVHIRGPVRPEPLIVRPSTAQILPELTPQQVKQEVKAFLQSEYQLSGEHMKFLDKLGDILNNWVDWASGAFEGSGLLELLGVGGKVAQGAGKAVGAVGLACNIMNVLESWKGVINAQETLQRIWGLMAIAYTTTAWGFGDSIPTHSPQLLATLRDPGTLGIPDRRAMETDCMNAWAVASSSTVDQLEQRLSQRYNQKRYLQGIIRAMGQDMRADTCDLFKVALEERCQRQDLHAWRTTYGTKYPG